VPDATLVSVATGLRTGLYLDPSGANRGVIQQIAGMALAYLAGQWAGPPPKAKPFLVTIDDAKRIVKTLKVVETAEAAAKRAKEEAEARAALSPEQAAQVERNRATARLVREAQVSKDPEYVKPDPESFSKNPKDAAECYAILDAQRDWHQAGEPGQSPVSGQQVRRADKRLNELTAENQTPATGLAEVRAVADGTAEPVRESVGAVDPEAMTDEEAAALVAEFADDAGEAQEGAEGQEDKEDELDLDVVA